MTINFYSLTDCDGRQPLSPVLYQILKRVFGKVGIANEGEKFYGNSYYDSSRNRYSLNTASAGEYYLVSCPFCSDTRKRLWINHYYGQLDANGRPITHLAICFNENCLSSFERRKTLADMLFGFRNAADRHREPLALAVTTGDVAGDGLAACVPPGDIELITRLPPGHRAYQYMIHTRRYSPAMLDRWDVGYVVRAVSKYREAGDRVYFPLRMHGELVGWQCRFVGDLNWREAGVPKYYTMPGFKRRLVLYNYDVARQYPFVVVNEGITSAHRVGGPAVALLGKSLSSPQMELLVRGWENKPIIFMLDPDAYEEMQGMVFEVANQRRTAPVISVRLPVGFDPADMEQAVVWQFLYHQAATQGVRLPAVNP